MTFGVVEGLIKGILGVFVAFLPVRIRGRSVNNAVRRRRRCLVFLLALIPALSLPALSLGIMPTSAMPVLHRVLMLLLLLPVAARRLPRHRRVPQIGLAAESLEFLHLVLHAASRPVPVVAAMVLDFAAARCADVRCRGAAAAKYSLLEGERTDFKSPDSRIPDLLRFVQLFLQRRIVACASWE